MKKQRFGSPTVFVALSGQMVAPGHDSVLPDSAPQAAPSGHTGSSPVAPGHKSRRIDTSLELFPHQRSYHFCLSPVDAFCSMCLEGPPAAPTRGGADPATSTNSTGAKGKLLKTCVQHALDNVPVVP